MSRTRLAYLTHKLAECGTLDLVRPLADYLDEPYLNDRPLSKKITSRMGSV